MSSYTNKVRPVLPALYARALLWTDREETAEQVLTEALRIVYKKHRRADARALRIQLKKTVSRLARHSAGCSDEPGHWPYIACAEEPAFTDSPRELQRYILLRFGCNASEKEAGKACFGDVRRARDAYRAFIERFPEKEHAAAEKRLGKTARRLANECAAVPDLLPVLRAFEADNAPKREQGRFSVLVYLIAAIAAAVLMFLLWILAILTA